MENNLKNLFEDHEGKKITVWGKEFKIEDCELKFYSKALKDWFAIDTDSISPLLLFEIEKKLDEGEANSNE
jgi:hypothetical protein